MTKTAEQIVARAVLEISERKYFYLQDDGDCRGALQYAANLLGQRISDEEADALIPPLRMTLEEVKNSRFRQS